MSFHPQQNIFLFNLIILCLFNSYEHSAGPSPTFVSHKRSIPDTIPEYAFPIIRNFLPKELFGLDQIWAGTSDKSGLMYFGTGECVLQYDGVEWRRIPIKPGSFVHSLETDKETGIIYCGNDGDFGFLEPDHTGTLNFHSLLSSLKKEDRQRVKKVRQTLCTPFGIFFNAKEVLIRFYKGHTFLYKPVSKNIRFDNIFFKIYFVNHTLFAEHQDHTLYKFFPFDPLPNGSFKIINASDTLNQYATWGLTPVSGSSLNRERFLIFNHAGISELDLSTGKENRLNKNNQDLYKARIYGATCIDYPVKTGIQYPNQSIHYFINTISDGIYFMNNHFKTLEVVNEFSGLADPGVYHLLVPYLGMIWTSTNNGISMIQYPDPVWYLPRKSGTDKNKSGLSGSIYDFEIYKTPYSDLLTAATSQGIFIYLNGEWKKIPDLRTQCFDVVCVSSSAGNPEGFSLLAGINENLIELTYTKEYLQNKGNISEDKINSSFSYTVVSHFDASFSAVPGYLREEGAGKSQEVFWGGRDGLYLSAYRQKKWVKLKKYNEMKEDIVSLAFDSVSLWVGTRYKGAYRLAFDNEWNIKSIHHLGEKAGLPEGQTNVFQFYVPSRKDSSNKIRYAEVRLGSNAGLYKIKFPENYLKSNFTKKKESDTTVPVNEISVKCHFHDTSFGKKFSDSTMQIYGYAQNTIIQEGGSTQCQVWIEDGHSVVYRFVHDRVKGWVEDSAVSALVNVQPFTLMPLSNGITYIGGAEGMVRYNSWIKKDIHRNFTINLRKVTIAGEEEDSIIFNGFYRTILQDKVTGITSYVATANQPVEQFKILQPEQNSITFFYAAAWYENSDKIRYSFKLEGLDHKWSPWTPDTKIHYTNLEKGKYTFLVKARNIFGKESNLARFGFSVKPHFYQSFWFYSFQSGFVILLLLLSIVFGRSGSTKAQKIAKIFATLVIFILFEYLQNFVEENVGMKFGSIVFLKIILNVILAMILLPVEGIIRRVLLKRK